MNEAAGPKTIKARKAELEKDPEAYRPSDSSDEQWLDMTLKSLPKGKGAGSGAKGSRSAGSAPRRGGGGMDSDVEDLLKDDPWTTEQIKSRHVIFIVSPVSDAAFHEESTAEHDASPTMFLFCFIFTVASRSCSPRSQLLYCRASNSVE